MPKRSAGILLYRRPAGAGPEAPGGPKATTGLEVLLVHPGGPFWAKKDAGAWSIPKGLVEENEEPLAAAIREFEEETGVSLAESVGATGAEAGGGSGSGLAATAIPLDPLRQQGGKTVLAWAVRGDFNPVRLRSNPIRLEWPPKSGTMHSFPEVDRAAWFDLASAREKILTGQRGFLDQLAARLAD
jgi:predicted NUDIX family NTP pyrophosphohydrolase